MVALPVIFTLIYGVINVDRIVDKNQQALLQAVEATRGSLMLTEHLKTMERSTLQFQVLKDNSFFQMVETTHNTLLDTVKNLSQLKIHYRILPITCQVFKRIKIQSKH